MQSKMSFVRMTSISAGVSTFGFHLNIPPLPPSLRFGGKYKKSAVLRTAKRLIDRIFCFYYEGYMVIFGE